MTLLFRQIGALIWKDLLLLFSAKSRVSTIWRAFVIPFVFSTYMSFILRVYWPKENYGIGSPTAIRSLPDAMNLATGGRNTLVLVNAISSGGDIDRVIQLIAQRVQASGKIVQILTDDSLLIETCRSTLQGTTKCYGAVIFNSSPNEGPGGLWNYTLRADAALGVNIDVSKSTNDAEIYQIPLQHAVDATIAAVNSTGDAVTLLAVDEYPFTSETQEAWKSSITTDIQNANANYLSVVWYIGFVGLTYQLVGLMAKERELGMSDLVESMMPNIRRWEPQVARLVAHHLAFTIVYGPSWIIMSIVFKIGLFKHTSAAVVVISFILGGLAVASTSILGASFFRKAQLSGISTIVFCLVLAIIAQITSKYMDSATVAIVGLLFSPMTFVFLLSFICRWEHSSEAANLTRSAPGSPWGLPGIVFYVLIVLQIFLYPLIAIYVERLLYGVASKRPRRQVSWNDGRNDVPVRVTNFRKVYEKNRFWRFITSMFGLKVSTVIAVDDISLTCLKGQILVLVGPNGCGKTTTLNAIAGLSSISGGTISVDGSGGIGLCPQKNVLWNGLSVEQHASIFHKLKSTTESNIKEDVDKLIKLCSLEEKRKSLARTLSGGQKRKLQLIMMLIGGSRVCCVDEVSGGLDPLSRRKVWEILLAERGTRTFILTTHFLDEAEYLADHMAILSKGDLKAEGSTSELKARLGNGYRFIVPPGTENLTGSELGGLSSKLHAEESFETKDPAVALEKIKSYRNDGVKNYQIAGPTIEEVFMTLTEAHKDVNSGIPAGKCSNVDEVHIPVEKGPVVVVDEKGHDAELLTGHRISSIRQARILFQKRLKILRWNWFTYLATFLIPVIAAGLTSILLKDFQNPGCSFIDQIHIADVQTLDQSIALELVFGPPDALIPQKLSLYSQSLSTGRSSVPNLTAITDAVHLVDSLADFETFTNTNFSTIVPGGLFLGNDSTATTFYYRSDLGQLGVYSAVFVQNAVDIFLTNQSIVTQYSTFDIPWPLNTADSIQFIFYFGLVMAAYPAFFALYPTIERLRGVRALQYSNGVRSLPLWLAYMAFDGVIVLLVSIIITVIFATTASAAWYYLGILLVCFFLYGITSVLLSYVLSLIARSQLSAFAFSAGGQAFMLVVYMSTYMTINTRASPDEVPAELLRAHFILGIFTPIGQLTRALMVALNLFSTLCSGAPPVKATNPGLITLYGGPIVYLVCQALFLFSILIWYDHGFSLFKFRRVTPIESLEDTTTHDPEVSEEIARVTSTPSDGLRVLHVSRSFRSLAFGKVKAVDDLTFGVKHGEVFALVGPNGAGKSTTISMLRGEINPSHRGNGRIFIGPLSASTSKESARAHLGVCPQHDAMDQLTVIEHLHFYAGIRGVQSISSNVSSLIRAVGLSPFASRMATKLSGGNKRKLSLAIALIGNPEVLLLDEPSSGMDPLAKRSMWKTLSQFVPNRSILLTTHSMEEADALADRVGVLATHLLDIGTTSHLRGKYGSGFHVHLVLKSAPNSSTSEIENVKAWIQERLPGAVEEREAYHGQLRFNISSSAKGNEEEISVGTLFMLLEENKESLGLEFHSVSPSTFDEVFLKVVEGHGVGEEDMQRRKRGWREFVPAWGLFRSRS